MQIWKTDYGIIIIKCIIHFILSKLCSCIKQMFPCTCLPIIDLFISSYLVSFPLGLHASCWLPCKGIVHPYGDRAQSASASQHISHIHFISFDFMDLMNIKIHRRFGFMFLLCLIPLLYNIIQIACLVNFFTSFRFSKHFIYSFSRYMAGIIGYIYNFLLVLSGAQCDHMR